MISSEVTTGPSAARTGVLIVGAGPTGLTLACELARRGTAVRIIEKSPEFHSGSRGKTLNPRSLEVFESLGILPALLAHGRTDLLLRKYRDGRVVTDTDPFAVLGPTPAAPYVRGLFIAQWLVEEILRTRLAEWGVTVELGTELTGLDQTEESVIATTAAGERMAAEYLVGCDGGRSTIRKSLPVAFDGRTEDGRLMILGDVEAEGLSRDYWHQWLDEDGAILLCPLGERSFQLQALAERDELGQPVAPSLESFQRIFDRHSGMPDIRLANPTWISTFRVNERMADRYRVGRVLLAGDAAHVHSIAGGLGMNTGVQDAFNLGWKLAMVVAGAARPALLDTYEEERLPIAAWTLDTSGERWRGVQRSVKEAGRGTEDVIRPETLALGLGYRWSSLALELDGRGSEGGAVGGEGARGERATDDGLLRAGDRAPDAPCLGAGGTVTRLFDLFARPHFTLLGFGESTVGVLRATEAQYGDTVRPCLIADIAEGLSDHEGHARRAYGVTGDAVVLVRPDGHVALIAPADATRAVLDYLGTLRS
ncbi:FAD-dependent oxidoreductase [Streptomyces sp. NPDC002889]|uniref:FAD-dependent oxidoreductase n=1 Tax=Streptomyces sp. NPDC002889 TaxID=3364669 RepID=UPI003676E193